MTYADLELWGFGVLGMSRQEFFTCGLNELNKRIEGFILRELELKNMGARRIVATLYNGFTALGGGKGKSESEIWPMSIDKKFKRQVEKSEDIVARDKEMLKRHWPDVKWDG